MSNQFLQYFEETNRNEWLIDQHRQHETAERYRESLEAQLAYGSQPVQTKMPPQKPQNHGPYGLVKAAFSHLAGHKVAATAR